METTEVNPWNWLFVQFNYFHDIWSFEWSSNVGHFCHNSELMFLTH